MHRSRGGGGQTTGEAEVDGVSEGHVVKGLRSPIKESGLCQG